MIYLFIFIYIFVVHSLCGSAYRPVSHEVHSALCAWICFSVFLSTSQIGSFSVREVLACFNHPSRCFRCSQTSVFECRRGCCFCAYGVATFEPTLARTYLLGFKVVCTPIAQFFLISSCERNPRTSYEDVGGLRCRILLGFCPMVRSLAK